MEWYFGNQEAEDLVVPKDYEQQEQQMMSSPESWSQWGMAGFGGTFLKKNFNSNMNMTHEELSFNGGKDFYTSIDMAAADSNNETSKSHNSSMSQDLYNSGGSLLWNDQADFQQFADEEARINHSDDIFFSSLLKEDPTKDSTESHENTIRGDNRNVVEGEMYASKENSMEEDILNDLERVTAQFTDTTRICFRDAFYRLAESSKQSFDSYQDGDSMITSNDDTLRAGETEDSESKTNVIDRAVASLVFQKFDFEDTYGQSQTEYNNDAEVPAAGGTWEASDIRQTIQSQN